MYPRLGTPVLDDDFCNFTQSRSFEKIFSLQLCSSLNEKSDPQCSPQTPKGR